MKLIKTCFLVTLFFLYLAGCANLDSVYRKFNINEGTGALVDIKQRAIIVSQRTSGKSDSTVTRTIVCAEPSPDVLSAYAAEIAAEADLPEQVTAKLVAAFQESSSFVGLRSQSIQLLRDSLYRLCEGYMNGALDKAQYDILMRRYQKYMVALLAIEQLTGTVHSPAVTISTQGSAEAARSISQMRSEIKAIVADIVALEVKKKAKGVTDEQKSDLDKQIALLNKDKEAITKGIENAQGLAATGSATAIVNTSGQLTQRSDQHIQAISKVVEKIVVDIVNMDDTGQLCWAYMSENIKTNSTLNKMCENYLTNLNNQHAIMLDAEKTLLQKIKASNSEKEDIKALEKMVKRLDDNLGGLEIKSLNPTIKLMPE